VNKIAYPKKNAITPNKYDEIDLNPSEGMLMIDEIKIVKVKSKRIMPTGDPARLNNLILLLGLRRK
jgi:hypothetical protein